MPKVLKIIGLVILVLGLGFVVVMWSWMKPTLFFDKTKIPHDLVTSPFIDFDRIYMISKFRSGAGHDYSNSVGGETCRSMKHYFNTSKYQVNGRPLRSTPTSTEPNIKIYAPFDGTITEASTEHIGTQVHIYSDKYSSYFIRIFHMDLLDGYKVGKHVKSGEWLGTIGPKDGTDFSVEANTFRGAVLLSYFEVMTDSVFAPYRKMGFKREDFIISKEERDAHPFVCGGIQTNPLNKASETFQHPAGRNWQEDFVFLKEDPYPFPGQAPVHIGPPAHI